MAGRKSYAAFYIFFFVTWVSDAPFIRSSHLVVLVYYWFSVSATSRIPSLFFFVNLYMSQVKAQRAGAV